MKSKLQDLLFKEPTNNFIPLHCLFELTYRCNLNCVHCYIVKNKKRELNKWKIFSILEQLKKANCIYLTLSGGEIFIRKDFFEIAEYARKLNFALRLFTNGTLITEEIVDKIKKLYPLEVEISLYGFKKTHERITRVYGSFNKTLRAIKLLRDRNIKVYVKTTLMKQNISEIWRVRRFVEKDLGARVPILGNGLFISPCDNGNRKPLNYRLTDSQLKAYIEEEFKQFKSMGKEYKPRKVKDNERLCGASLISCNMTPYGEVNPCVQIRLKKNNNLSSKSFMEIWEKNEEIKRLRSLRIIDREDCRNCELISYCFVCPGIAFLEKGSLLARLPEACRQARMRKQAYESIFKKQKRFTLHKKS